LKIKQNGVGGADFKFLFVLVFRIKISAFSNILKKCCAWPGWDTLKKYQGFLATSCNWHADLLILADGCL
jgi:hypothetical protein